MPKLPDLDLPDGIELHLDEHGYQVEVYRRLPSEGVIGTKFDMIGYIDTYAGHVYTVDSHDVTESRSPQRDVDWILRRAPAPRGPDGRACGHPL